MTPKNEFVLSVVSFQEPDLFSKWPQVIEPKIWATEIRAFPSKDGLYEQEVTDQKFQEHVRNEIF